MGGLVPRPPSGIVAAANALLRTLSTPRSSIDTNQASATAQWVVRPQIRNRAVCYAVRPPLLRRGHQPIAQCRMGYQRVLARPHQAYQAILSASQPSL